MQSKSGDLSSDSEPGHNVKRRNKKKKKGNNNRKAKSGKENRKEEDDIQGLPEIKVPESQVNTFNFLLGLNFHRFL